jgi:ribose-phosphate pyrophosphokinase
MPTPKHLESDVVICYKQRKKANVISHMELIGDVTGKNVVLVDDMVDTAGTLTKAADLMMERGALSVRAICTHPILSGNAYKKLESQIRRTDRDRLHTIATRAPQN